jgi:predicted membrane chloride channel (bestrophin family)
MSKKTSTRQNSFVTASSLTELQERRNWQSLLFSKGTVFDGIILRVLFFMSISLVLCVLKYNGFAIPAWKSVAHALLGVALGLLLVYRTNASTFFYCD